jgi:phage gp36-like protein
MSTLYCIEQDIIDSYGSAMWMDIADENDDGQAEGVTPAIAWASGMIDARIGRKYELPLVTIPDLLREVAVDLSIVRRATTADRMTDELHRRLAAALDLLKEMSTGEISLGLDNPPLSNVGGIFTDYKTPRQITNDEWEKI